MSRNVRLVLCVGLFFLLAGCAGGTFKPCTVTVEGVRLGKGSLGRLPGALLDQFSGRRRRPAPEFIVTLRVANPNDRGVEVLDLSGVVLGPEGEVGTFRLPPGRVALPAQGAAAVDIVAAPGPHFLSSVLAVLMDPAKRGELTASGYADISTWLGPKRVTFKKVRLARGPAAVGPTP